jgi:hypothetical protein
MAKELAHPSQKAILINFACVSGLGPARRVEDVEVLSLQQALLAIRCETPEDGTGVLPL